MRNLKLFVALLAFSAFSLNASAGDYRLDESSIETTIEQAQDITLASVESLNALDLNSIDATTVASGDSKFVFLAAAFFCGSFGIHRYYAGASGLKHFGFHFCTGGLVARIDFAAVLFNGTSVSDYSSDDLMVW